MKHLLYIVLFVFFSSCKDESLKRQLPGILKKENATVLNFAKGFNLENYEGYSILEINNPWPKSDKVFRYALIDKEKAASITLAKDNFDGIVLTPIESIVVTSTTHIPALELLKVEHTLTGFPGCDYISSANTRALIEQGKIRELGKNEGLNTEVLLELRPDVVVGFGVDGTNKTFETVKKSGIPVIYNGDWVEQSPLAKAEWIKFFGALFQKEREADSIFKSIETDYLKAIDLAKTVKKQPTILSGAMHKDVWYLPNGTSPEAQFLKDANTNYLWKNTTGHGSLALSFESVLDKAQSADIWLSPSYYTSYKDLRNANAHYSQFSAFKNKSVYTFSNTKGASGGVLYYELGTARPDLVLKDIIKICHPELLNNYEPYFFKPLE